MMKMSTKLFLCLLVAILVSAGCSTTSRLEEGEVLYTGVKKIAVSSAEGSKVPAAVESAVKDPLNVKPNNPLYSPYLRTPFPTGLWAYNHLYRPDRGEKQSWLYRRLARKPVLISDVRPQQRVEMERDILNNLGYFGSSARFDTIPSRNPKRARLGYAVTVAAPWFYSGVRFPDVRGPVTARIDSLKPSSLLQPGRQYNVDTLQAERNRIADILREEGYYYFRPDYLTYQADTLAERYRVDLRMITAPGIPAAARRSYRIGRVGVELTNPEGGTADSMRYNGIRIGYERPLKLRPKILSSALTLRPGATVRMSDIDRTLNNLNRLGVFRYVNLSVTPLDSLKEADTLDVMITGAFELPLDARLEADFSSKSNSYIGPGVSFGLRNRNFLGGGEHLAIDLKGVYEWQTGNTSPLPNTSAINSYQLGINASLAIPRMVAPRFIPRSRRYDDRTTFGLGASLLNRPRFFTMLSANTSVSYDFQTSPYGFHNFTPFRLTYNNLLRTTDLFDQKLADNRALRQSFENQFIPALSYTYTFDRPIGRGRLDRIFWQTTLTEAGNIISGVQRLFGVARPRYLFGASFSEFVKGTTELKYYKAFGSKQVLVARLSVGAGHAYGDFTTLPYTELFYVGGANSIRAFTIRSLGPGSFRPDPSRSDGYFDQNGDFKLEGNLEYRFNLLGKLNGALFVDAGNIWLLKDDPLRPGARLSGSRFFDDLATGTGVGLRFDITYLVIRADLGIGIHAPYDTGRSRYYNIPRFRDGLGFHLAIGYPF
jgi:outer membrane protein assembly factor BamA